MCIVALRNEKFFNGRPTENTPPTNTNIQYHLTAHETSGGPSFTAMDQHPSFIEYGKKKKKKAYIEILKVKDSTALK